MEKRMLNTRDWTGSGGAALGGLLYVDMTSDENNIFETKVEELFQRIQQILNDDHLIIVY